MLAQLASPTRADTVAMMHSEDDPSAFAATRPAGEPARTATAGGGRPRRGSPPDTIGRHQIIGVLGAGGMGVVYEAYDAELDRRIALKVLPSSPSPSGAGTSLGNARLLREAQAMAQLSHPHVIPVFDAGVVDNGVFVAMELVRGCTLEEWLRAGPHPWQAVLGLLLQAGEGLAAAHEANLIHREFKPANILCGDDGRVRVCDFGLAREPVDPRPGDPPGDDPGAARSVSASFTEVGAVLGTPAYMSPEQHRGEPLDERSDQFSFCVTAWEAIYGRRPFRGETCTDLARAVCSGESPTVPEGARVPTRLERALRRGLAIDSTERWPSMRELLRELARIRRPRRGWLWAAAAFVLIGVGVAISAAVVDRPRPPCRDAPDHLAGVWDDRVRGAIRGALAAQGSPGAVFAADRVVAELDDYSRAWVAMRTDACRATHVRGEQSEALLDRRMHCLDRQLDEMRALTEVLADAPDRAVVNNAVNAALDLTPIDHCADIEALGAAVPLPADAEVREKIERLRAEIERARALKRAGKYRAGLAVAERVATEAQTVDYPPLLAEALYAHGDLLDWTGAAEAADKTLRAAAEAAAVAEDDHLVAASYVSRVYLVGVGMGRVDDALEIAEFAATATTRARDDRLRGALENHIGGAKLRRGDYRQALAHFERAVELRRAALGPDHPDVASSLSNAGAALRSLGDLDRARDHQERALAVRERTLGENHPLVAQSLTNLGAIAAGRDDHQAAHDYEARALALRERAFGTEHPEVASSLANLGAYAKAGGRCDEAVDYLQRAVAILDRVSRAHPLVSRPLDNLGECLTALGKHDQAIATLERAVSIAEAGDSPMSLAHNRFGLGMALWAGDRDRDRAVKLVERARDGYAAVGAPAARWQRQAEDWLASHRRP